MSGILILSQEITDERKCVTVQGKRNKVEIIARNGKNGSIWVITHNASHAAYRGPGKTFWSWGEALDHYKSSEMKGILQYVAEL